MTDKRNLGDCDQLSTIPYNTMYRLGMDGFMDNKDMSIVPEKIFASDSESENEDEVSDVSKTFRCCKEV